MCLLKVYLEDEGLGRRLIAQEVTLITKEDGKVQLRSLDGGEITLNDIGVIVIDSINSICLIKKT
ncbi:hypothetical protein DRO55_03020 [Candidatus Bathyarchaeota archaeon]|nr:MAG: hypothetical protein DRO55_03020 [Candidatus Bathyarchaeota archaeon]